MMRTERLIFNIIILGQIFVFSFSGKSTFGKSNSIEIVKSIADKVINDTSFELNLVPEKSNHGIQILDFRNHFGDNRPCVGYALSYIISEKDVELSFGLSSSDGVKIWINNRIVFQHSESRPVEIKEIDYDLFNFQDTLIVNLQMGINKILVKLASSRDEWVCFLRALTTEGFKNREVHYSLEPFTPYIRSSKWLYIGPFQSSTPHIEQMLVNVYPPEDKLEKLYKYKKKYYVWDTPKEKIELNLLVKPTSVYKKDAYINWNYANGLLMFSIYTLADITGDQKYINFVRLYCNFIIDHLDYFREQYESRYVYNGAFYQIFRMSMLDDAGVAALPFIEMYNLEKQAKYLQFVEPITDYILHQQIRLKDGAFCRVTPVPLTVWVDDLFMSVPFMLFMGKITGENTYYDEVALQIINFHKLLFDSEKGLFNHGWFQSTNQNTTIFWGRANGWVLWAISEALIRLPQNHSKYQAILNIFQKHIEGIIKMQDPDGMWYQVLDHPESFEETSCTAMFILGIARGVSNGWLDNKYREIALKAWDALCEKKIEPNGVVHDICQGTGIGNDLKYYFNRKRYDNDPRGLGAVIIAGIEVSKLKN